MKVLVGASVRRNADILRAHLTTLQWQKLPKDVQLDLAYVDDLTPDQREQGRALLQEAGATILDGVAQPDTPDFSDSDPVTHRWQLSAFERVAANKQKLLDYAVANNYDYVWICDTDLLLDPYTLWSMLYADKPVVAAVYWTRWQNEPAAIAGPQVWLRHPYQLDGRGLDFHAFRQQLADRMLVRVYGGGACMLVRTGGVLRKGVGYWPLLPELIAQGGMMAGEDRTFSVLCEHKYIPMYADSWPDIFHVYHPQDAAQIPYWLERLAAPRNTHPSFGDLVNFVVEPLEDPRIQAQHIRGRLGALKMLPEIEQLLPTMQSGESVIQSLKFPVHYTFPEYRGQQKVYSVTLVDHMPHHYAPTLAEEYGSAVA